MLEATTFASMIFSFNSGKFEGKPLPPEAQFAPAFGLCVADLDGDGTEDLFISQNFFAVAPDEQRCDAGRGLWLRGNGRGELAPVPGQESGIAVYGDQRGCAVGDYDGDGRVDLAVAQNANATRLYHNVRAIPGLRIRLKGPARNPTAIGAALRLEGAGRKGPVREVQAGSGYWSQNSAVQVMSLPEGRPPESVWVQWPGGRAFTVEIPRGAKEIEIGTDGSLTRWR